MKGMCYIILIVAFLMFYQREPVFSIIIIGMAIGIYLFFRTRRIGRKKTRGGILSSFLGRPPQPESNIEDLVTLMMVQQLFNDSHRNEPHRYSKQEGNQISERELQIEKSKNDILELFDDMNKN